MRARTKRLQAVAAIAMHGQWDRSSFPMKQSRSAENRASGPDRTVNNLKECSFKNFACPPTGHGRAQTLARSSGPPGASAKQAPVHY